jgi:hypothetical protein
MVKKRQAGDQTRRRRVTIQGPLTIDEIVGDMIEREEGIHCGSTTTARHPWTGWEGAASRKGRTIRQLPWPEGVEFSGEKRGRRQSPWVPSPSQKLKKLFGNDLLFHLGEKASPGSFSWAFKAIRTAFEAESAGESVGRYLWAPLVTRKKTLLSLPDLCSFSVFHGPPDIGVADSCSDVESV